MGLHPTSSERQNQILDVGIRSSSYYNEEKMSSSGFILIKNASSRGYLSYDKETDTIYSTAQYTFIGEDLSQKKVHKNVVSSEKTNDENVTIEKLELYNEQSQQEWRIIMIDDKSFSNKFEESYGKISSPRNSTGSKTSVSKNRSS